MALPNTRKGYQVKLDMGSTAETPVYSFVCGIDTTGLNQQRSVTKRAMRDCAAPFALPSEVGSVGPASSTIAGSGLVAVEQINALQSAFDAGVARWFRVQMENGPTWTRQYFIASLNIDSNADGEAYSELSISLESTGPQTYTPVV